MVQYSIVVLIHARAKLRQATARDAAPLDFDVHEDPEETGVFAAYLHQLIGVAFAVDGTVIDGLEFFVQKCDGVRPVDLLVQHGRQQLHKGGEVLLQGFFSWAIEIGFRRGHMPGFLSVLSVRITVGSFVEAAYSFTKSGTFFPVLRAASNREGGSDLYTQILNLCRVRVVVTSS